MLLVKYFLQNKLITYPGPKFVLFRVYYVTDSKLPSRNFQFHLATQKRAYVMSSVLFQSLSTII